jgi:protein-S-isoprenylcysteine O-methyltransferase Ste14
MISEIATALLLAVPLVVLAIQSVSYWSEFKTAKERRETVNKTSYPQFYFYLLIFGVLCMWVSWVGGIVLLVLGVYQASLGLFSFTTRVSVVMQTAGLLVFYLGGITYNWSLAVAGKYLRPAPSGIYGDHRLVREGPFGVVRHPLYVSYILISAGLGLALLSPWMLVGTLCLAAGIYPAAKAEEEVLVKQFGGEYVEYQRKVGMFFPRLF